MQINGHFVKIVYNIFDPDDLGIKDKVLARALEDWVSPKIIPDGYFKEFRSIIAQLNVQFSHYSLETSIARFATEKSYAQWMIDNKRLMKQFEDLRNKLILSYDTFEPFIKESNKDLINYVWGKISKDGGNPTENFIIETNKKIIDLLPSKENLYNSISLKIMVFKIADSEECEKILVKEIKSDLKNIVSSAFDTVINFYNKEKEIRRNMLSHFKKEMDKICLLYFCGDIKITINELSKKIYDEEFVTNPAGFINYLSKIKNNLVKGVGICII